jgi:hypothetical protein
MLPFERIWPVAEVTEMGKEGTAEEEELEEKDIVSEVGSSG